MAVQCDKTHCTMPRKNEYKPIPEGTKFGKLTVGKFVGFDHRRRALFECVCELKR